MATANSSSGGGTETSESRTRGSTTRVTRESEPTIEGAFAADGVDLTVIRWMLDRSPEERLAAAQSLVDAAAAASRDEV